MPLYKYNGPDAELSTFGRVGCGSILELNGNQIEEIGPEWLESWTAKDTVNILPYGSVPYVLNTTGLTHQEKIDAEAKHAAEKIAERQKTEAQTPSRIRADKRAADLTSKEQGRLHNISPRLANETDEAYALRIQSLSAKQPGETEAAYQTRLASYSGNPAFAAEGSFPHSSPGPQYRDESDAAYAARTAAHLAKNPAARTGPFPEQQTGETEEAYRARLVRQGLAAPLPRQAGETEDDYRARLAANAPGPAGTIPARQPGETDAAYQARTARASVPGPQLPGESDADYQARTAHKSAKQPGETNEAYQARLVREGNTRPAFVPQQPGETDAAYKARLAKQNT